MSQPFKPYNAPFYADPMTGEPRRPFGEDDGAAPAPVAPNPGPNRPSLPGFAMSEDNFKFAVSSAKNAMAALSCLQCAATAEEVPGWEAVARTAEYANYLVGCVLVALHEDRPECPGWA